MLCWIWKLRKSGRHKLCQTYRENCRKNWRKSWNFQSIRILQKLLKSEKELVKSFKTFLSNCDISKNLPSSVEKFSNRIKKVPKGFWIDEIFFYQKVTKLIGNGWKKISKKRIWSRELFFQNWEKNQKSEESLQGFILGRNS